MSRNILEIRPIFIVGAPRSGTTLLQFMLRSHPRISLPTGESHFFIPIYKSRSKFGNLRQPSNIMRVLKTMYYWSPEFLETDFPGLELNFESILKDILKRKAFSIPEIFSAVYEANALGEGKCRWGEKTPYYLLHMTTILEMYPKAQIIHIIRDGRDVALSLFRRHLDFGVYNVHSAAEYWSDYVERGQMIGKTLPRSAYMECRYEDLVSDPYRISRRICEFLNEDFDEKVVNYKVSNTAGKTPLLQKPIDKVNFNKWRNEFNPYSIRVYECVAGKTLCRNGYELTSTTLQINSVKKCFYRLHNALCNYIYRKNCDEFAQLISDIRRLLVNNSQRTDMQSKLEG